MFPIRANTRTLKLPSFGFYKLNISFKCFFLCPAWSFDPNINKLIYISRILANFLSRQFPPLVGNDAVHLAIEELFHRHEALFLKDPGLEVKLVVLPAVVLPFPAGVPLMQRHIAAPYPMGVFTGELAETTPQSIKTINLL